MRSSIPSSYREPHLEGRVYGSERSDHCVAGTPRRMGPPISACRSQRVLPEGGADRLGREPRVRAQRPRAVLGRRSASAPPISGASVVEPPDGSAFTQIAAGDDHTCGATTSGELYCWSTDSPSPQKLSGGPYFDDLRGVTGEEQTPPDGAALVDCEPDLNVGIGPPP